jgi:hypothetical protein
LPEFISKVGTLRCGASAPFNPVWGKQENKQAAPDRRAITSTDLGNTN